MRKNNIVTILKKNSLSVEEIFYLLLDDFIEKNINNKELLSESEKTRLFNSPIKDNSEIQKWNKLISYNGLLKEINQFILLSLYEYERTLSGIKSFILFFNESILINKICKDKKLDDKAKKIIQDYNDLERIFPLLDLDKKIVVKLIDKNILSIKKVMILFETLKIFSEKINRNELFKIIDIDELNLYAGFFGRIILNLEILSHVEKKEIIETILNIKINNTEPFYHIKNSYIDDKLLQKTKDYFNKLNIEDIYLVDIMRMLDKENIA